MSPDYYVPQRPRVEVDTVTTLRRIVIDEVVLDEIAVSMVAGVVETRLRCLRHDDARAVTVFLIPEHVPNDVRNGMRFRLVLEPIREDDES